MRCFGKTDIGIKRKSNQDYFRIYATKHYTCAVVCDGMGGAKGGSVASRIAATVFIKTVKASLAGFNPERMTSGDYERILANALNIANSAVYEKAATSDSYEGMGTTLVAFLCVGDVAFGINTGDSRLYSVSGSEITKVTKDHSFVQYLVDTGEITEAQAEHHPQKNIILKVVGVNEMPECDIYRITDFDKLFLCTDGLTNTVSKEEIRDILTNGLDEETQTNIFIDLANERGGADNITAVVFSRKEN